MGIEGRGLQIAPKVGQLADLVERNSVAKRAGLDTLLAILDP